MKHLTKIVPFIFVGAAAMLFANETTKQPTAKKTSAVQSTTEQAIQWLRYDEGLKKASKEDKHVFIDFTASWCGWCKKMDKETFAQPDVVKLINDQFVPVKVWGDSRDELDIDGYKISEQNLTRQQFGVSGFPSFWFLKSDGSKLAQIRGYRDAEFMMEALTYVAERKYDTTATEQGAEKKKAEK
jgi:thioredoxin-related protein